MKYKKSFLNPNSSNPISPKLNIHSYVQQYDLMLLQQASAYNLKIRKERTRSNTNLVDLFMNLTYLFKTELFIEVGAKEATASITVKKKLKSARVIAFEANPYTYEKFVNQAGINAIEYLLLAVSDCCSDINFNFQKNVEGMPLPNGRGSTIKRIDDDYHYETISVPSTTLDFFLKDHKFSNCILWIDIEGAIGLLLKGAKNTIKKSLMLIIEVEDKAVWQGQWLSSQVNEFLYKQGFIPIARDFQSCYQYNIIYIHQSYLPNAKFRLIYANFLSEI